MEFLPDERLMREEERKVVGELAGYREEIWRDRRELFFKSRLWEENLKWDPPMKKKKKNKGDVEEEEELWRFIQETCPIELPGTPSSKIGFQKKAEPHPLNFLL
ncbi:hypothetical protein DM860_011084 [Cuscuta australis]|uniref:Uncharacterized protein n=1 Tax=Cuscuta australis TaxID=267555 RepID=A0A328E0S8_9ASTE|nr:hypothetical protein DM860_011084 [Cuscuta australis]